MVVFHKSLSMGKSNFGRQWLAYFDNEDEVHRHLRLQFSSGQKMLHMLVKYFGSLLNSVEGMQSSKMHFGTNICPDIGTGTKGFK